MTKQTTRYCFTLNNYIDDDIELLRKFHADFCSYLVYGKEVGASGTPHLQGFFTLKNKLSMVGVHKALGTKAIALLVASGTSYHAALYCKKGDQSHDEWKELKEAGPNYGVNYDGEEFGKIPSPGKRTDLDLLCDAVAEGKSMLEVATIHPASYVRNYRGLANLQALQSPSYTHETCRGIWIWGPPGTGKSTRARSFCSEESLFIKPQSKWWDGYASQTHILLDDLDGNFLGHYLKIWADKYACTGEIKGGTVKLSHTTFIVTSNYSIEQLYKDDTIMAAAIKRRFKVEHMTEVVDPVLLAEQAEKGPTVPYMFKPKDPVAILNAKTAHMLRNTPSRSPISVRRRSNRLPPAKFSMIDDDSVSTCDDDSVSTCDTHAHINNDDTPDINNAAIHPTQPASP